MQAELWQCVVLNSIHIDEYAIFHLGNLIWSNLMAVSLSFYISDFITNFLLCQESFQTPSQDLFLRLTQASVLPFYLLVLSVCLLSTLHTIYRRLRSDAVDTHTYSAMISLFEQGDGKSDTNVCVGSWGE